MTGRYSKPKIRLYVDASLRAGADLTLDPARSHYLLRVMRASVGSRLRVFNGRDGEWRADITGAERTGCRLQLSALERAQTEEPGPWLAFTPLKKDALDVLIIKATELGAATLQPVFSEHSAVDRVNHERLRAQAIEAAEQCGRLTVPTIGEARRLRDILADWPRQRPLLVMHPDAGVPARCALARPAPSAPAPSLLIGPEGGWSTSELDDFRALPFVTLVTLGPRTLRAETAAIAAIACWQALAGDWSPD